jgi:hypothetical protein
VTVSYNEIPGAKRRIDQESSALEQGANSAKRQRTDDAPSGLITQPNVSHDHGFSANCQQLQTAYSHPHNRMEPDVIHPATLAVNPNESTIQGKFLVTKDELLHQAIADYGKVRFDLCWHWCSLKEGIDRSEGLLFPGKTNSFYLHSVLNPSSRNLEYGP